MPINVFTHYDKPVGPQGLTGLVLSHPRAGSTSKEPIIIPMAIYIAATAVSIGIGQYAGAWIGYYIKNM